MKKSKIDHSSSIVYLPEEIILKILTQLPAKSIGRCRCVSQRWRTLLSDPKFIETHLDLSRRRSRKAVVLDQRSVFEVDFHDSVASSTELKKLEMPSNLPYGWMGFSCSYNGLILAQGLTHRLFLLNPTTLECKELPKPPAGDSLDGDHLFLLLGIGYNKVVAISHDHGVYVCSFGSDTSTTWNRLLIPNSALDDCVISRYNGNGVFCNGSIHWLGTTRSSPYSTLIIAFDLTKEMFRVVPAPLLRVNGGRSTLGVVGGSLCITYEEYAYEDCHENHLKIDVWVMNEYGMESSWTKLQFSHHRQHIGFFFESPLYLGNEEFMLISSLSKAVIHNMQENSSRDIVIGELPFDSTEYAVHSCTFFVDSLVSPSQLIH